MERYWCLRWLLQEGMGEALGHVLREALVRLETIPLVLRVPSLPELPRGARVSLDIEGIDLLEAELRPRYRELAPELAANTGSDAAFAGDEGEEPAE
jgi:exoribonuclease-2